MTPRNHESDDAEVTRSEVREMIREYDRDIIMPREMTFSTDLRTKHEDNLLRFSDLWKAFKELKESLQRDIKDLATTVNKLAETVTEWKGSIKVVIWMIGIIGVPILLMVAALFADLVRWGATHGWKY